MGAAPRLFSGDYVVRRVAFVFRILVFGGWVVMGPLLRVMHFTGWPISRLRLGAELLQFEVILRRGLPHRRRSCRCRAIAAPFWFSPMLHAAYASSLSVDRADPCELSPFRRRILVGL